MVSIDQVLEFWFGEFDAGGQVSDETKQRWFKKSEAFDAKIRDIFEATCEQASRGELNDWASRARGRLALIIVLDQFPRNIYRDSPQAFASDPQAVELALDGIACGHDLTLPPSMRIFLYMPLMHAEDLALQNRGVEVFEGLANEFPPAATNAEYARRHRDVIADWGRFPHRNHILGRETTAEEAAFLKTPGSSF